MNRSLRHLARAQGLKRMVAPMLRGRSFHQLTRRGPNPTANKFTFRPPNTPLLSRSYRNTSYHKAECDDLTLGLRVAGAGALFLILVFLYVNNEVKKAQNEVKKEKNEQDQGIFRILSRRFSDIELSPEDEAFANKCPNPELIKQDMKARIFIRGLSYMQNLDEKEKDRLVMHLVRKLNYEIKHKLMNSNANIDDDYRLLALVFLHNKPMFVSELSFLRQLLALNK